VGPWGREVFAMGNKIILVVLVSRTDLEFSNEVLEARVRESLRGLTDEWEVEHIAVVE